MRDKEKTHRNIVTKTGVTATKIKISIADIMTIDPFKLLSILTESIHVTLIEIQGITTTKGQIISNRGMMIFHTMKNLSLHMLRIQVSIIYVTLR